MLLWDCHFTTRFVKPRDYKTLLSANNCNLLKVWGKWQNNQLWGRHNKYRWLWYLESLIASLFCSIGLHDPSTNTLKYFQIALKDCSSSCGKAVKMSMWKFNRFRYHNLLSIKRTMLGEEYKMCNWCGISFNSPEDRKRYFLKCCVVLRFVAMEKVLINMIQTYKICTSTCTFPLPCQVITVALYFVS